MKKPALTPNAAAVAELLMLNPRHVRASESELINAAREDALALDELLDDPAWAGDAQRYGRQRRESVARLADLASLHAQKAAKRSSGSAKGGAKGAATRDEKAVDPARVEARARSMGWPENTSDVNATLAKDFDRTPERIGQILRSRLPAK